MSGRLGALDTQAATNELLYLAPQNKTATVIVQFCNRTGTAITVRLAHIDDNVITSIADEDYLAYGVSVAANATLEYRGIVVGSQHCLMTWASAVDMSITCHGFEE